MDDILTMKGWPYKPYPGESLLLLSIQAHGQREWGGTQPDKFKIGYWLVTGGSLSGTIKENYQMMNQDK